MANYPKTLQAVADILKSKLHGSDAPFTGVSTDSRTVKPGELFFALRGEHFDAQNFLAEVVQKKAAGAVVSQENSAPLPIIPVANTKLALGELAAHWRSYYHKPLIGITGSCGKTTTKTLLAHILQCVAPTLATQGTLNNDIGLPLTLLKLQPEHAFAVIEMGANHAGEIAYLANIAKPDIAVITNAEPVHLEGFGSLEGVARAKGEIYDALAPHGIAILNQDDPQQEKWRARLGNRHIITFSKTQAATVHAQEITLNHQGQANFILEVAEQKTPVQLQVLGEHNVMNALAAAAAAHALNISIDIIKKGLENTEPPYHRGLWQQTPEGAAILDDCYNANPTAFRAAIHLCLSRPAQKYIVVMGKMGELGPEAAHFHHETGAYAKAQGIHELHAVGEWTEHAVSGFGENAFSYADKTALITALKKRLDKNTVVLIKGSRSAGLEEVVNALLKSL